MNNENPAIEDGSYAVIFYSERTPGDDGYAEMAQRMAERAAQSPGYLGAHSVRDAEGRGITVSYWRSPEDIARWKADAQHQEAQSQGKARWYADYRLTVARVVRNYGPSAK